MPYFMSCLCIYPIHDNFRIQESERYLSLYFERSLVPMLKRVAFFPIVISRFLHARLELNKNFYSSAVIRIKKIFIFEQLIAFDISYSK